MQAVCVCLNKDNIIANITKGLRATGLGPQSLSPQLWETPIFLVHIFGKNQAIFSGNTGFQIQEQVKLAV